MFKKQNILKTPKISFRTPKKFPKILDLNNNNLESLENTFNFCIPKRKDTMSTNESDDNINNVNKINDSFEESNQKEQFVGIRDIMKSY